jgi:hypothetical protein
MNSRLACFLLLLATSAPLRAQVTLDIALAHGTAPEKQTKAQLEQLLARYDLSPWIFTKSVIIDEQAIPHSHPTLTLHTRHLKDDELLLSTFVHEQLHWFVGGQRKADADEAVQELKKLFPTLPVGYPEGSNDEPGNYTHLLVIPLEYRADRLLLGELRAREVMEFWATDHYTRLYKIVLENGPQIGSILRKHNLVPGMAPTANEKRTTQ